MSKIILGCGTGRCGTLTLSYLLNGCKGAGVCHEDGHRLPWVFNLEDWGENITRLMSKDGKYIGNIAFYYLNYIEKAILDIGAKVIILRRDKDKVISSFMSRIRGHNHFKSDFNGHSFDICFPNYEGMDLEGALYRYYDEYYDIAEELIKKYPNDIKIFDTDSMNSEEGQDKIFDFCGIEEQDRVYLKDTYHNVHLDQK